MYSQNQTGWFPWIYHNCKITDGMRILEIGAGTGRYSHTLARRGFCVDAVELAEHNIELFRRNTAADEPVTIRQGDARDLSAFADETYDVTLLLGPMYHLFTRGVSPLSTSISTTMTMKMPAIPIPIT